MQRKTYIKNAAILTITGFALRIAGMFFRVYIAARIGAEGMGLYQLIYTVYGFATTLATAGLAVLATRVTAGLIAQGKERQVRSAMRRVLMLSIILGVGSAVLLYFVAEPSAKYWINDNNATIPLKILAPSLPFMAVSAVLRGYFMAYRKVEPNAKAQIFEQIVRISLVMGMLAMVVDASVTVACSVVMVGTTISEVFSWMMMQWYYGKDTKKLGREHSTSAGIFSLLTLLIPISATQYVASALHTYENVLVPNCLAQFSGSRDTALAQYGALKGMAMPVLFFPFSFLSTLATLLIPEIIEAYTTHNAKTLRKLIQKVMLITLGSSILAATIYTVYAKEISLLLYKDIEIAFYIAILGPLTPFMYMESMVDGILKGMDQQVATFRYTVVDSIMRIILIYALLPKFGIWGFLFVMLVSNIFTSLLNLQRMLKVVEIHFDWKEWLFKPVFAGIFSTLACKFVFGPLLLDKMSMLFQTLFGAGLLCAMYLLLMWLSLSNSSYKVRS